MKRNLDICSFFDPEGSGRSEEDKSALQRYCNFIYLKSQDIENKDAEVKKYIWNDNILKHFSCKKNTTK